MQPSAGAASFSSDQFSAPRQTQPECFACVVGRTSLCRPGSCRRRRRRKARVHLLATFDATSVFVAGFVDGCVVDGTSVAIENRLTSSGFKSSSFYREDDRFLLEPRPPTRLHGDNGESETFT